jgi:hypothetical protein
MPIARDLSQKQQAQRSDTKPLHGVLDEVDPIVNAKEVAFGRSRGPAEVNTTTNASAEGGGGFMQMATGAAEGKLRDYATKAVDAVLGSREQAGARKGSESTGIGHAIDEAAKKAQAGVKEMAVHAADAALSSRLGDAVPPEMRGPAKIALQALGSQMASRVSSAIADAAETAHKQVDGVSAETKRRDSAQAGRRRERRDKAPAPQQHGVGQAIDDAAKKAQAGVKEMAAHAADAALGSRLGEAVPPEMRGPAKMALQALGSQMASRVSSAIADAAETAHKQIDGANTINAATAPAPQQFGVGQAIDEAAKKAQAGVKEMAAHAADAALGSRLAEAVPPEMRGAAKIALQALGSQVASRVSSAIADAAETAHKQIDGASADKAPAPEQYGVGQAIDEAAKKAQAGVKEMAAHAADAALGSRLAEAVPPEMRGPAKIALQALGSQVASRVSSAIADAAETAHKQIDGANADKEPAPQSEAIYTIDEAARKAQAGVKEMAAHAAEAALGSRLAEAVPPEMRGPAKAVLQALGSQVAGRVSSAIADAAETAHKRIDGANAASAANAARVPAPQSGVGQAIDEAAKKAQAGVKEMAAHAADAALSSRLGEAVPPEMRGPAKMALEALGSQVASRVSSAIADAAEKAHQQIDGANAEPSHE